MNGDERQCSRCGRQAHPCYYGLCESCYVDIHTGSVRFVPAKPPLSDEQAKDWLYGKRVVKCEVHPAPEGTVLLPKRLVHMRESA